MIRRSPVLIRNALLREAVPLWNHRDSAPGRDAFGCGVAAGERGIYFNTYGDGQTLGLLDFRLKKFVKVTKFAAQGCGFSLSPDGRRLLFALENVPVRGGSDLMLVERFR